MTELILEALRRGNLILTSTALLAAFSLGAYLFVYNVGNAVARSFVLLLATLVPVYVGDLFMSTARLSPEHPASAFWLRGQWFGIGLAAVAFVAFANALLEATGDRSRPRRALLAAGWALAVIVVVAAVGGGWIVGEPAGEPGAVRLRSGPLFSAFAVWHLGLVAVGAFGIWRARQRALTPRTRRRTLALLVAVVAPLSIFPVLTAGGASLGERPLSFRALLIVSNASVTAMLLFVAWEVAYRGVLTPERAVRRDLVKYLVHGPLLGAFVLATIQLVPVRLQESMGLPRDIVLMLVTIAGIVIYQLMIRAFKPWVDRLIYSGEGDDVRWLRRIDERLVSERDLRQLLEMVIALICDRLRVRHGAVVVLSGGRLALDAIAGDRSRTVALLEALDANAVLRLVHEAEDGLRFTRHRGFLLHPLRPESEGATLGLLAVEDPGRPLELDDLQLVEPLINAAEQALRERVIQQRVVAALRELEPEIEGVQRIRGALEPATASGGQRTVPGMIAALGGSPVHDPDFGTWVKEALSDYWGGPRLTDSPLRNLGIVRRALDEHDGNPARAVRSVLDQAIEQLKPDDGARSMTASEWLLYNILELKFVRGLKVRDIAARLAVSESALYRKQRVAIDALAAQLRAMESHTEPDPDSTRPTSPSVDVAP